MVLTSRCVNGESAGVVSGDASPAGGMDSAGSFERTGPLRLLMVEDHDDDASLVVRAFEREGIALVFERVATAAAMTSALVRGSWDLVIADDAMPSFGPCTALEILRGSGQAIPFIVVSGIIGELDALAERVRQLVDDVRIFSRGGDESDAALDVHRVLDSTLRMSWNDIRHRACVVRRYAAVKNVRATEERLGHLFLHLLVNAAQAIASGDADENEIRVSTRMWGEHRVVIAISDTGPGTAPSDDTELGLLVCRRIVSELGGEITVSSEEGLGTSSVVVLPATNEVAVR